MKILRLVQKLPPVPGGMEMHARELSRAQAEAGAAVTLVYAAGKPPEHPRVRPIRVAWTDHGFSRFLPEQHRFAWQALRSVRHLDDPPEIVHAHGDYALGWVAAILAKRYGCPAVLTIHAGLSERWVHRMIGRRVFPRLTQIVGVSEDITQQLEKRGVPRERLSAISSGIHTSRYSGLSQTEREAIRRELGLEGEAPLVVGVGRLHPLKGFQHLIEAARGFAPGMPHARVVIVGEGPEREALERQAEGLPQVRLIGPRDGDYLARLLQAADLFVLPSVELGSQREGTPTSVMEAMAAGLPVVVSRTGGNVQLVQDGVNGALVPPGGSVALGQAVTALLGDPVRRRDMGQRNRAAVRERDWCSVVARVDAVYERAQAAIQPRRAGHEGACSDEDARVV